MAQGSGPRRSLGCAKATRQMARSSFPAGQGRIPERWPGSVWADLQRPPPRELPVPACLPSQVCRGA